MIKEKVAFCIRLNWVLICVVITMLDYFVCVIIIIAIRIQISIVFDENNYNIMLTN